ncbi:tetratricopeptide repeat protein [Planctomycetes bacterium Pan216]|uniref:Tetratricopeptide repeat protein n=1 Tax=Kolteria novifilia TaxID=2527975 RepID=A0A518B361_9BACT|nr:tetratricopeptide repeat protein [Planctomycetes bacterium Pan216]
MARRMVFGWLLLGVVGLSTSLRAEEEPTAEQVRQHRIAERFEQLLERNPRRGAALDRLYDHHVDQGTLDQFVEGYRQRVASDPADGTGWMLLGLIETRRGDDAGAIKAYRQARDLLPDNALAPYYLGQMLVLTGQGDLAAKAFEESIDRKPKRPDMVDVFQALGRVHQRAHRHEQALEVWNRLEERFPGDRRVQERIATILSEEGEHEGALQRYEKLVEQTDDRYQKMTFAIQAADLTLRLGKRDEALTRFEKLLGDLNPKSWVYRDVRRRIDQAFLRNDDLDGLTRYYAEWIEDHPDDIDAMVRLAKTLANLGRVAESRDWFAKAVEKAPSDTRLRRSLIDQLLHEKKIKEALAHFEALNEIEPNDPDLLREWGGIILDDESRSKREREAAVAKLWHGLVEARPDDAVISAQVADLFRQAKMRGDAVKLYRRAIELAPAAPQYREYLGEYLHSLDRREEARTTWAGMAEGANRSPENLVRFAEVLDGFGYEEEALVPLAEAIEEEGDHFPYRLQYARLLADAKAFDKALAQIDVAERLAESDEEMEECLRARIGTLEANGKLAAATSDLAERLRAEENPSADQWMSLARYHLASRQSAEALAAIRKAIARDDASVRVWLTATEIFRLTGDLQEASEALRHLSTIDRRFRTDHLTQLAEVELELGRRDQALQAGRDLLAAAPGSPEHYQTFAQICFRLGEQESGLDALRRAVRSNPSDPQSLMTLASTLAEQFRTEEAVSLYWRAFAMTDDLDGKLSIVSQLAELYLRTNDLDRLLTRLDRYGRDRRADREAVLCKAQVHLTAGDYGSARAQLEGLVGDDSRDTVLLGQLVMIAEKEGDLESAARFQKQINEVAPSEESQQRLARFYVALGKLDDAKVIWKRLGTGDRLRTLRTIDRLLFTGKRTAARELVDGLLASDEEDWEALYRSAYLCRLEKEDDKLVDDCEQILALGLDDDESSILVKGLRRASRVGASFRHQRTVTPLLLRWQAAYKAARVSGLVTQNISSRSQSIWSPTDFGQARMVAIAFLDAAAKRHDAHADFDKEWKKRAEAEPPNYRARWDWYYLQLARRTGQRTYTAAKLLRDSGELDAEFAYVFALRGRLRTQRRAGDAGDQAQPAPDALPKDELDAIVAYTDRILARHDTGQYGPHTVSIVLGELRLANRGDEAKRLHQRAVARAKTPAEIHQYLNFAAQSYDVELTLELLDKLANLPRRTSGSIHQAIQAPTIVLLLVHLAQKVERHDELLTVVDAVLAATHRLIANHRSSRHSGLNASRPVALSMPRKTGQTQIAIKYPKTNELFDATAIMVLRAAYELFKSAERLDDFEVHFTQRAEQSKSDVDRLYARLALGYFHWWNEDRDEAIAEIEAASELPGGEVFKIEVAELYANLGDQERALEVLDAIDATDQSTVKRREQLALKLAIRVGDIERARKAAERLFGIRLDHPSQLQLANQMKQLSMHEMADAVLARVRSRAGRQSGVLMNLMTEYEKQGKKEVALEIAHQLLRNASSRRAPASGNNQDDAAGQAALQVIKRSGKLEELIKQSEEQLERTPGSEVLSQRLATYYVAAGRNEDSLAMLKKLGKLRPHDTSLLVKTAQSLAKAGHDKAALKHYLDAFKLEPRLLQQHVNAVNNLLRRSKDYEPYVELLESIDLNQGGTHPYYFAQTIQIMAADPKHHELGVRLFRRLWDVFPDQRHYLVNSLSNLKNWWKNEELYELLVASTLPNDDQAKSNPWFSVDQIYSWSSDGIVTGNVKTLLDASREEKVRQRLHQRIEKQLEKTPGWKGGRALLALLALQTRETEKATSILEELFGKGFDGVPSYARWVIAQELGEAEAMQPWALKLYEGSFDDESRHVSFGHSPAKRLVALYRKRGDQEKARDYLVREAAKGMPNNYDQRYAAYENIQNRLAIAHELLELKEPGDALRVYTGLKNDRESLETANSFRQHEPDYFGKQVREGVDRSLSQLDANVSVDPLRIVPADVPADATSAIDDLLFVHPREISSARVRGLFELSLTGALERGTDLEVLRNRLEKLRQARKDDLSVAVAESMFLLAVNDAAGAERSIDRLVAILEKQPLAKPKKGRSPTSSMRARALRQLPVWLVARNALFVPSLKDRAKPLVERSLEAARMQAEPIWELAILNELALAELAKRDTDAARPHVERMLERILPNRNAAHGDERRPSIVTQEQFEQAMQAARLAQQIGMEDISLDFVEQTLHGGNPVKLVTGNPNVRATTQAMVANASRAQTSLSVVRTVGQLDLGWREADIDPARVYEVLAGVVFPKSSKGEVLLYRDGATDNQRPDSIGQMLCWWAVRSDNVKDLRQRIEAREGEPGATLPAAILKVQLGLAASDDTLTREGLLALQKHLEENRYQSAISACLGILPALEDSANGELAEEIVRKAFGEIRRQSKRNEFPAAALQDALVKSFTRRGDYQAALEMLHTTKGTKGVIQTLLGMAAGNVTLPISPHAGVLHALTGDVTKALDQMEGIAKQPHHADLFIGTLDPIAKILQTKLRAMPATERYDVLRRWALPMPPHREIRSIARFLDEEEPPASFTLRSDTKERQAPKQSAEAAGEPGSRSPETFFSTTLHLIDAAEEAGKLDELIARLEGLVERKVPQAADVLLMAKLSAADDRDVIPPVDNRLADVEALGLSSKKMNERRFWNEYLLARALMRRPDLEKQTARLQNWLRRWATQRQWLFARTRVDRDFAIRKARTQNAGHQSLGEIGPFLWLPGCERQRGEHATGLDRPWWVVHEDVITHLAGPGRDTLSFRYPLEGSFTFEVEAYQEFLTQANVGYGELISNIPAFSSMRSIYRRSEHGGRRETTMISPMRVPSSSSGHFNRHRLEVSPEAIRHFINGQLVDEEGDPSTTSPWISLVVDAGRKTVFRFPRLEGNPSIPKSVRLIDGDRMEGWVADTYGEKIPVHHGGRASANHASYTPPTVLDEPTDWSAREGVLEGPRVARRNDTMPLPSRIYYHRPLADKESIEYEFFYRPDVLVVHPALDRLTFLLEPDGVRLHWMTAKDEFAGALPPANAIEVPEGSTSSGALPLKVDDWNRVKLTLEGETAVLTLNGKEILRYRLEPGNDRLFSFFHYKDRGTARVRDVVLRGDWPASLSKEVMARMTSPIAPLDAKEAALRHDLTGEEVINREPFGIHRRATALPPEERYERLLRWVLPSRDHDTVRVGVDWAPDPVLPNEPAAGALISPAVLLIETARDLGRLEELATAIDHVKGETPLDARGRRALQTLVAAARGETAKAHELLKEVRADLETIAKEAPARARWPEVVVAVELLDKPGFESSSAALLDVMLTRQIGKGHRFGPELESRVRSWAAQAYLASLVRQDKARLLADDPFWHPVSRQRAERRGLGFPTGVWSLKGESIEVAGGTTKDLAYFAVPLEGTFDVTMTLSRDHYSMALLYDDYWFGVHHDGKVVYHGAAGSDLKTTKLAKPLEDPKKNVDVRLQVADGVARYFLHGEKVHERELGNVVDPWLALRPPNGRRFVAEHVRVSGKPTIPAEIRLSGGDRWEGSNRWNATYFRQSISGKYAFWSGSGTEIVAPTRSIRFMPYQQSLLRYHRPLAGDGTITYEFHHDGDRVDVHPALDRLCFMIDEEGVRLHRLTDGPHNRSSLDSDNLVDEPAHRRGSEEVPLRRDAWNEVSLTVKGDIVQVSLNGSLVYERPIESSNRRFFGFFRYPELPKARIRNVTYRGNWPKELSADDTWFEGAGKGDVGAK